MLESFSGGYYLTELRPEVYEEGPVVSDTLYDEIEAQYKNPDLNPWLTAEAPGQPYFTVSSERSIPTDVIGLPEGLLGELGIDSREREAFFVTSAEFAQWLLFNLGDGV